MLPNVTDLYLDLQSGIIDYGSLRDVCKNVTFLSLSDESHPNFYKKLDLGRFLESAPKLTTFQVKRNILASEPNILRIIKDKARHLKCLIAHDPRKHLLSDLKKEAFNLGIEGLVITNRLNGIEFYNRGVFS